MAEANVMSYLMRKRYGELISAKPTVVPITGNPVSITIHGGKFHIKDLQHETRKPC